MFDEEPLRKEVTKMQASILANEKLLKEMKRYAKNLSKLTNASKAKKRRKD